MILEQQLALGKIQYTCFFCGRSSLRKKELNNCLEIVIIEAPILKLNDKVELDGHTYNIGSIYYGQGKERLDDLQGERRASRHDLIVDLYGQLGRTPHLILRKLHSEIVNLLCITESM